MSLPILPWAKISLGLVIACLLLLLWGKAEHASAERWEAKSIAERDNHLATKANVRAAQAEASRLAREQRLATEERSRQLAERADHAEHDLLAARAAAARFADAHRVPDRAGSAAGRTPGRAGTTSQADTAPRADGPGADAVVLQRGEFDQLVSNTLRLERARAWAQSLIDEGFAVVAAP